MHACQIAHSHNSEIIGLRITLPKIEAKMPQKFWHSETAFRPQKMFSSWFRVEETHLLVTTYFFLGETMEGTSAQRNEPIICSDLCIWGVIKFHSLAP